MMQLNTVERARGRWREILPRLGIDTAFLTNRHGPCPFCGGRDRYRFDDKDGTGSYYCSQCGAGVGIIMVRKLLKCDYKTACDEVDKIIGNEQASQHLEEAPPPKNDADRRKSAIERLLVECTDRAIVSHYLIKRGLRASSPVLLGHSSCPYFDNDQKLVGRFPAVVAPIIGPDGSLQSATRIYDADVTPRKKMLPPVASIAGAAVRLHEPKDGRLAVCEGIETGLAVRQLFGHPVWAALSDNGISTFVTPADVKHVLIYGDHDANYVGQAAAYALAKRLVREKLTAEVHIPPDIDTDWLDVLTGAA